MKQCDLLLSSSCLCPPLPSSWRTVLFSLPRACAAFATSSWWKVIDEKGVHWVLVILASHWKCRRNEYLVSLKCYGLYGCSPSGRQCPSCPGEILKRQEELVMGRWGSCLCCTIPLCCDLLRRFTVLPGAVCWASSRQELSSPHCLEMIRLIDFTAVHNSEFRASQFYFAKILKETEKQPNEPPTFLFSLNPQGITYNPGMPFVLFVGSLS